MRITPTKRGKIVASVAIGALLGGAAVTVYSMGPEPSDESARIIERMPVGDPYQEAWTVEELLLTCDNDYEVWSDVWESCVDTVLTATCLFEPFTEDSEWFTAVDVRCSGGRVTEETPVFTD